MYDSIVIGGGVVGCAIVRELSKYNLKVALLERGGDVAEGISKANSGVLHCGFNVKAGSLKARFNLEGLSYFPKLAQELDVEYRYCGKLVVARKAEELPYLEKLLAQGKKNGCAGLSIINRDRMHQLEPLVTGVYALLSEATGIITPFLLTIAYAENAQANGAEIFLNAGVSNIETIPGGGFRISTTDGRQFSARTVVNSVGNQAAGIANMLQPGTFRTYPCRGEYFITDKRAGEILKMAVYPVPPADGSGLGVHLTPTMNGNILIGPSADYQDDSEDTANRAAVMKILKDEAYDLLPPLKDYNLIKAYAGIRPKLFLAGQGSAFEDFYIAQAEGHSGFINLIGIESPGLTASPAIAKYVVEEKLGSQLDLKCKDSFNPQRRGVVRASMLGPQEREDLIKKNPAYADMICRCEQVSRAEIEAALDNPLGAKTLDAVKKRTHAMMGRCQGGFCLPRIVALMQSRGMKPESIRKRAEGDYLFSGSLE